MKMKIMTFGKTSMTFELSTLKLGFRRIFIKTLEKKSWLDFDWFLTNSEKNEDEDGEISESKFDFWLNDPQKI